jgi:hypothetical protein
VLVLIGSISLDFFTNGAVVITDAIKFVQNSKEKLAATAEKEKEQREAEEEGEGQQQELHPTNDDEPVTGKQTIF